MAKYCENCGWPVAPEGVTLTGSDAKPAEVDVLSVAWSMRKAERCTDTACTYSEVDDG